jgi:hypothetical protein
VDGIDDNTSDDNNDPHSTTHNPHQFLASLTDPLRQLTYWAPSLWYDTIFYIHATTSQYPELPATSPLQANLVSTPPLLGGGEGEYNCNDNFDYKYDNAEEGKGLRGGADNPTTMVAMLSAARGLGVEDVDHQPPCHRRCQQ